MFKAIYQAVRDGNAPGCDAGVTAALQARFDPAAILNEGMVAALARVGHLFEQDDCSVPEMLVAAWAMNAGLQILRPVSAPPSSSQLNGIDLGRCI